jgi:hypothetical protein
VSVEVLEGGGNGNGEGGPRTFLKIIKMFHLSV